MRQSCKIHSHWTFIHLIFTSTIFLSTYCNGFQFSRYTLFDPSSTLKSMHGSRFGLIRLNYEKQNFGKKKIHGSKPGHNIDFLTRDEEINLMYKIQRYNELYAICERASSKSGKSLSVGEWAAAAGMETYRLLEELNQGNKARVTLVKSHEVLVESIARKYMSTKSMSQEDLIQEGSMGLMKAAEKFQPDRGYRFSTFGRWWIKAAILRAIENKDQMIRLPVATAQRIRKITSIRQELESQNGYQASEEEIADALGISVPELRFYDEAQKTTVSTISKKVEASSFAPEDFSQSKEDLAGKVSKVLEDNLAPDEVYAVQLRFGLLGSKPKSFNEIGKMMHLSGEGIRKKISKALQKIQQTETATQILLDFIL